MVLTIKSASAVDSSSWRASKYVARAEEKAKLGSWNKFRTGFHSWYNLIKYSYCDERIAKLSIIRITPRGSSSGSKLKSVQQIKILKTFKVKKGILDYVVNQFH